MAFVTLLDFLMGTATSAQMRYKEEVMWWGKSVFALRDAAYFIFSEDERMCDEMALALHAKREAEEMSVGW